MTASPIEQHVIDAALAVVAFSPDEIDTFINNMDALREAADRLVKHREHKARMREMLAPDFREGVRVLIAGPRQSGKTVGAVRWLTDPDAPRQRILLTRSQRYADEVLHRCRAETPDFPADRILTAHGRPGRTLPKDADYGIDEAADILTTLLRLPTMPELITVCTDER